MPALADQAYQLLEAIGRKRANALVVGELLESLMVEFGGPQKFAKKVFIEFKSGKEGGMARQRMITDIFRLFQSHTNTLKGIMPDPSNMNDAELRAAMLEMMGGLDGRRSAESASQTATGATP
jgi:hypothetical protein